MGGDIRTAFVPGRHHRGLEGEDPMASRSGLSLRTAWEAVRQTSGTLRIRIHVVSGERVEEYWREGLPASRADHLRPAGPLLMVGFRAYGDELHICISRDTPAPARAILPMVLLKLAGVLWMADRQAPPGTPAQACALLDGDGRAVYVEQRPRPRICPDARDGRRRHSG